MNIYVSKLNFRTTGESLQALFAQYGEVSSVSYTHLTLPTIA